MFVEDCFAKTHEICKEIVVNRMQINAVTPRNEFKTAFLCGKLPTDA